MNNVIDEVLAGEPRYIIKDNGVRLYSSNGTYTNGNFTLVVEYTKTTD